MQDMVDDTCVWASFSHTYSNTASFAWGQKWNPLFWLQECRPVKLPQFIPEKISRSDFCNYLFSFRSLDSVWAGRRWLSRCLTCAACKMRIIHRATPILEMKCQAGCGVRADMETVARYLDRCCARVTGMSRVWIKEKLRNGGVWLYLI